MNLSEIKKSDVIVDKDYALYNGVVYSLDEEDNMTEVGYKVFVKERVFDTDYILDLFWSVDHEIFEAIEADSNQEFVDKFVELSEAKHNEPFCL